MTMYVYESTENYPAPIVAVITGETNQACENLFATTYGMSGDYCNSYTPGAEDLYETADTEYLEA